MKHAVLSLGLALLVASPIVADPDGETEYAKCAACHLPDGAGVEGAFPPLRDRVAIAASTPEGREYLVLVVTAGLFGSIEVDGVSYFGAMPAQGLSDDAISAVLNYIAQTLRGDEVEAGGSVFTSEEIARIRAAKPDAQPNATRELRQSIDWSGS